MSLVRSIVPASAVPSLRPERDAAPASAHAFTLDELWQTATYVAESGLFAVKTPQQAFTLMLLCQAEGMHPVTAMRRYHVVQGRPVMRSDAVQGEMQARGWKIRPVKRDAREARAVFSHPSHQPDGFEMGVTAEQYKFLLTKDNWKNHPDDMLWARLVTKACRTLDPGIVAGIYSPEEVDDMTESASPAVAHARADADAARALRAADTPLPGDPPGGYDARPYTAAVKDVAAHCGAQERDLHNHLWLRAAQHDRVDTARPKTLGAAVARLARLYETDRGWCRDELAAFAESRRPGGGEVEAAVATEGESQDDGEIPDEAYPPDEPGSGG